MSVSYRVGVDIGGTFTDIVLLGSDGTIHTKKLSSSVDNYAQAIVDGLGEVFRESGLGGAGDRGDPPRHHGRLQRDPGAQGRARRPDHHQGLPRRAGDPHLAHAEALRPRPGPSRRRWSSAICARWSTSGSTTRAGRARARPGRRRARRRCAARRERRGDRGLPDQFVRQSGARADAEGDRSLRKAPGLPVSISFEVLPEIKEYERTSTTVINAYVMPIVATYLRALRKGLDAAGIPARLLLMQSNGGLTTDAAAAERPMNIIESGPGRRRGRRAGARAREAARQDHHLRHGRHHRQGLDGRGRRGRARARVCGRRRHHDRLAAAHRRRLHAEGAGDRSRRGRRRRRLACLDRRRRRAAGRARRARARRPGRSATTMGGAIPTITDANVLLGYINPAHLVGGALKLNAEKARAASPQKIAQPLGMSLERAAYGAHLIAASNMIRAIKAVSTERGRDPRDFALFAFGGNGPLFAAGMAAALGIRRIVVPPSAGLFSSFGLLYADVEHHYARTFRRLLRQADLGEIEAAWDALARAGERAACGRRLFRRARAAQALGRAALQGPELRADRAGAGRPDRRPHGGASRGSVRRRARAHLRPSRRPGGAGRAGGDPAGRLRAARRAGGAAQRRDEPAAPAAAPQPREKPISGEHGWLETPVLAPRRSWRRPRRPADRRGIRRDLPGAARRARRDSTRRAISSLCSKHFQEKSIPRDAR